MKAIRLRRIIPIAATLLVLIGTNTTAFTRDDSRYFGKDLNYWIKVIHDRTEELIPLALDVVRESGPDGRAAIPDLIALVEEPFSPIQLGRDSRKAIASKLYDIEVRADAIDTLATMGESASSATGPLIRWALTPRVIPELMRSRDDEELFVELVMMDAEQRIRIAGAIAMFGKAAAAPITRLLVSKDEEERKFGVAILNEGVIPITAKLLRSRRCEDRDLGLRILRDMELVVAPSHLEWLERYLVCDAN